MEESLQVIPQYAAVCCVTVVIAWFLHWAYNEWVSSPPCKEKRLPPGSMGFPIIGETLQFFKTSHSIDILPSYYRQRLNSFFFNWTMRRIGDLGYGGEKLTSTRYGPVFKTSLVGQPLVISLDPEFNRGQVVQELVPRDGKQNLRQDGTVHKFTRSLTSKLFGPENLKETLIGELEVSMKQSFAAWAAEPSIEVKDSVADMIFDLMSKKMISMGPEESRELRKNFEDFFKGILCFPIYFPGSSFYKCMKGRRHVHKKLTHLLKDRLSTPEKKYGDLLDPVVEELRSEKPVIDETFAIDALAALLFGSFATISGTLTIGLKLLTDNPDVVKTLKEEHETILKKREDTNARFTWEEYKSLTFTTQVMNEINRLSNVAPGIFRKALTDVQVNGYTIPAGWLVMICTMATHLNPTLFEDPLKFNPWRWTVIKRYFWFVFNMLRLYHMTRCALYPQTQDETKRSMLQRNFMPFGGGIRLCLGADFSKLFISLFLHVLVANYRFNFFSVGSYMCVPTWFKYFIRVNLCSPLIWNSPVCRWNEIKGGEVIRVGGMLIPKDYHIQLFPTT
ncbi:hypothetical protein U9M48_029160 [Paspalum notatum var. saurae]|uniref:Cytochrome P450 n=1 Tax=Paspalum notatum var. saurae TaxID=547442 RepID=A0AAQ3X223_PASNO